MLLKQLLGDTFRTHKNELNFDKFEIERISRDSKHIEKDDAYFCLSHDYEKAYERCEEALKNGAKVVLSDFTLPFERMIKLNDTRDAFANACANFYGRVCDQMKIVGITGTNGKTTTSHVVAQMLKRNGINVGVIGTSGVFFNGKVEDCPLTTPDADFLHKTFFQMKMEGIEYVIMEVSAHAIDQKRINGINFDIGVLTNITQDHLDYFKTFDSYAKSKLSFFDKSHMKMGIVCADDKYAASLIGNTNIPIVSYGLRSPSDAFAIDVNCSMNGSRFVANIDDSIVDIKTNLIGEYNVYNSLAALSVCKSLGLDELQLARGLNFINPVEGRFNVVNFNNKYVVVDFAHSPDSLMNVLKTAKSLTDKNVYVVFGCGGNRDKSKRPQMGAVAEEYADYVCLTDDNPRNENSLDIIKDIEEGMKNSHFVEPNRQLAIKKMLDIAQSGDIIIVAGKGAEKYQEIDGKKLPYNDFDAIYNIYKELTTPNKEGKVYDC